MPPFLNFSPIDIDYNGIGDYIRYSDSVGVATSIVPRSQLSIGTRYQIVLTLENGASLSNAATYRAYVNGVYKKGGSSVAFTRPIQIGGYQTVGRSGLVGELIQCVVFSTELSAAQIATMYGTDGFDFSTLPGLTDWWFGGDFAAGALPNRVAGRPAITLVNK